MTHKLIILIAVGLLVFGALVYVIVKAWRYRRNYRLKVLDVNGFALTHDDHIITVGTQVLSSNIFEIKDVNIQTDEYWADDRGYDNNGCCDLLVTKN